MRRNLKFYGFEDQRIVRESQLSSRYNGTIDDLDNCTLTNKSTQQHLLACTNLGAESPLKA